MRKVAAHLHRHDEVLGCSLAPLYERVPLRQAVEGVVELNRRERLGEVFEPLALRHLMGVEGAPPRAVLPARGANEDHKNDPTPGTGAETLRPGPPLSPGRRPHLA